MRSKPIIIVSGEPNSIFLEIFFKTLKKIKLKRPIILISSQRLVKLQMQALGYKFNIKLFKKDNVNIYSLKKNLINLINVDYNQSVPFKKISSKSKKFIDECFKIALYLIKLKISDTLINGPVSKKHFLSKKYLGITEYLQEKTNSKNSVMLIYNKALAVCPLTTHIAIKKVTKKITKNNIIKKIIILNNFYKMYLNKKPKIAVTGLNPHCESNDKINEDQKIIKPCIEYLKNKKINIDGPFSADTIFLKQNRKKFNVVLGMYHDQVLTPLKTLYEYDAINITLGLPFIRISPDHGPNENMLGKNSSNPLSLVRALEFSDK